MWKSRVAFSCFFGPLSHCSDDHHKKGGKKKLIIQYTVCHLRKEATHTVWPNYMGMWFATCFASRAFFVLKCRDPVKGKLVCGQVAEYYVDAYTDTCCVCASICMELFSVHLSP